MTTITYSDFWSNYTSIVWTGSHIHLHVSRAIPICHENIVESHTSQNQVCIYYLFVQLHLKKQHFHILILLFITIHNTEPHSVVFIYIIIKAAACTSPNVQLFNTASVRDCCGQSAVS